MIEGVKVLNFNKVKDSRGFFLKAFNEKFFNINNIKFKIKEHFTCKNAIYEYCYWINM